MNDRPRVILMDLPPKIHGLVWHDENGYVTICLNARDSRDRQKRAYFHEYRHIVRGDLDNTDYREYG